MDYLFGDLRLGSLRLAPRSPRRRTRVTALQAAGEYTARWGWAVALGAAEVPAGTSAHELRELGGLCAADTPLLLPTGRRFDVLDVPEQPGVQALVRLERMGTQVGPVLASPAGRLLFFVAPGAAEQLPELLYRMGWDDASLDLACHGAGRHVPAPPTVLAGLGAMRWLRRPCRESAARPPEARLLLGTLAYACHRTRVRTAELAS